ncbi:hypothetical protein AALA83_03780 [Oscillospiraceae bacterium 44-5]
MKRKTITHAARMLCVLALALSMTTTVTRSEDGGEIRKTYDL